MLGCWARVLRRFASRGPYKATMKYCALDFGWVVGRAILLETEAQPRNGCKQKLKQGTGLSASLRQPHTALFSCDSCPQVYPREKPSCRPLRKHGHDEFREENVSDCFVFHAAACICCVAPCAATARQCLCTLAPNSQKEAAKDLEAAASADASEEADYETVDKLEVRLTCNSGLQMCYLIRSCPRSCLSCPSAAWRHQRSRHQETQGSVSCIVHRVCFGMSVCCVRTQCIVVTRYVCLDCSECHIRFSNIRTASQVLMTPRKALLLIKGTRIAGSSGLLSGPPRHAAWTRAHKLPPKRTAACARGCGSCSMLIVHHATKNIKCNVHQASVMPRWTRSLKLRRKQRKK